jgi:hypothetical protein
MQINSDINVLGSLPDWSLVKLFLSENMDSLREKGGIHSFTAIKTDKSVKRFEKAIRSTLIHCSSKGFEEILYQSMRVEGMNAHVLILLFWNASANNDLLFQLNEKVFFPAFYSGRVSVKNDEVVACIKELRMSRVELKSWSDLTITMTASKYLTLLKKFGLMEGSMNKSIVHPHLSDGMFVLFAYWITAISDNSNLANNPWLSYAFCERQILIDRFLQKKFAKYFNVVYTGDKLRIETIIPYDQIYEHISES